MATIRFILQSDLDNTPIYLRLSLGRVKGIPKDETPKFISFKRKTGLNINSKKWSKTTGLPLQNYADEKNLTTDLLELRTFISKKLNEANSKGVEITGDWLIHNIDLKFERITETKQSELITDAIQSIIDSAEVRKNAKGGIGLSKSRVNAYKSLKNILIEYQKANSYKIKDVNVKFAKDFLKHLLHKKNYSKSYALKKIADLKTVCYDAELEGIETHPQLKKVESAKVKNEHVIYLTPSELEKIENADIDSEALQNARKWLLLGCNIGQRGGDLLNLNEDNFVIRNGYEVIELTQQKTGKNVTIPVLETTKKILKTGLPYKISIQKLNDHIKDVCEIAELDEMIKGNIFDKKTKRKKEGIYPKHKLITTHICRRSFATNEYGSGIPTSLIMKITAHSTEKMFLNYIGKDSLDYAQQIADFYTLQAQKARKKPQLTVIKKAN